MAVMSREDARQDAELIAIMFGLRKDITRALRRVGSPLRTKLLLITYGFETVPPPPRETSDSWTRENAHRLWTVRLTWSGVEVISHLFYAFVKYEEPDLVPRIVNIILHIDSGVTRDIVPA